MAILHFRYKERRRSVRVTLTVPLKVHGQTEAGEQYSVQTESQSVSQHGASFAFEAAVVLGQILKIENDITRQKVDAKVVAIRRARDGKTYLGVEFASADANFWHMAFPAPGARPLRRLVPKVSGLSS
jgi:c-di-GMP-binding flagellar brake protein YcgR